MERVKAKQELHQVENMIGMSSNGDSKSDTQTSNEESKSTTERAQISTARMFKHQKPKLPTFSGDVRDCNIFKSDFKHAMSHHMQRETL